MIAGFGHQIERTITIKDIGDMADNIQKEKTRAKPVRTRGGPEAVDVHVGSRVRQRRTMLGMSQEKLGEALGLTFQQVQKYETGNNRVAAGRLYEIATYFGRKVNDAFADVPAELSGRIKPIESKIDDQTQALIQDYETLTDPELRARIGGLEIGRAHV